MLPTDDDVNGNILSGEEIVRFGASLITESSSSSLIFKHTIFQYE